MIQPPGTAEASDLLSQCAMDEVEKVDVHNLLPKDKHDNSTVNELLRLSDAAITPILPELMTWVQDINWPIAADIMQVIGQHRQLAEPLILDVLRGTDEVWKYNILSRLMDQWPSRPGDALMGEIVRIARHPTPAEVADEVDQAAAAYLSTCG